jgi:hypothetical protein
MQALGLKAIAFVTTVMTNPTLATAKNHQGSDLQLH